MRILLLSTLIASTLLTGCSLSPTAEPTPEAGASIQGRVHGGQQPVVGASVYLYAAGTSGYGAASTSLLNSSVLTNNPSNSGQDGNGNYYVITDTNGNFNIGSDYSCTSGQQVYLYAVGGNPGAGTNHHAGFLAILGSCPAAGNFASATPFVFINEVSTIAAAYAFAGFATDATHVSGSGTVLAKQGMANAFANAAQLANIATGAALATTPNGNGTVAQNVINTLANILAACINSDGQIIGGAEQSNCYTLINNDPNSSSQYPTDTATAAIYMAQNPGNNPSTLFQLQSAVASPFQPEASGLNDLTVGIQYAGGSLNGSNAIAIDSSGNAWVVSGNSVTVLSPTGSFLSTPGTGYKGGGVNDANAIAIDTSGNAWITNFLNNTISKVSSTGVFASPSAGWSVTGFDYPTNLAIDASGNAWVTNQYAGVVIVSPTGVFSGQFSGHGISYPYSIAIDTSSNAWIADGLSNALTEITPNDLYPTGANGYTGAGFDVPAKVAIDSSGNIWVANRSNKTVNEISSTLSLENTITAEGGLQGSNGLAIDGGGNVWVSNMSTSCVTEISNSGTVLSPSTGFYGGGIFMPNGIALDPSGDVWVANSGNTVVELIGSSVPVVTPIAAGLANNMLGTRP